MDPERIAAAVRGCPGVAGLSAGQFGEVASYLPGRRVNGVRITEDGVETHVVLWYGIPVDEAVVQIRSAVRAVAPEAAAVDVVVADLALAGDEEPGEPGGVPAGGRGAGDRGP